MQAIVGGGLDRAERHTGQKAFLVGWHAIVEQGDLEESGASHSMQTTADHEPVHVDEMAVGAVLLMAFESDMEAEMQIAADLQVAP